MLRHRALFAAACLFNLAVGGVLLFGRAASAQVLQLDPASGSNALLANLAACLIICFGALYAMIAADPRRLRPTILLGAAGKLAAVVCAALYLLQGGNPRAPLLAMGDLLFVVLFIRAYLALGRAGAA